MTQDELVAAQAARQRDPNTKRAALATYKEICRRMQKQGANQAALMLQEAKTPRERFIWLRQITDLQAKAADGLVPCKAGCSACCSMAVFVSVEEAQAIAAATGRVMHMPDEAVLNRRDNATELEQYTGVPCTMLKDGMCGIYDVRPHACRNHLALDRDNLLCHIVRGHPVKNFPMMHNTNMNMLYLLAHGDPLKVRYADIREFFPHG